MAKKRSFWYGHGLYHRAGESMSANHFQIRDPIHGVIFISLAERAVIDSVVFQRLRNIKQVGFLDFAFPAASHSRYCHSLGAMCMASKVFERVIAKDLVKNHDWLRMSASLRLAALLHDIGHPPLSHTTEMLMPKLCDLYPSGSADIQATHEDFTLKLILDSELTRVIEDHFLDIGVTPAMVASLLDKTPHGEFFLIDGIDFLPILRQIISSEIDADRMDYLLRDSFFCGVNYGKFDSDWLMDNLVSVQLNSKVYLGFKARAIFAFEDFLLSRYHMFASVYLHHTPVIMEKMLERFFKECPKSFHLPSDMGQYIKLCDLDLWQVLRQSENQWADRIVRRRPYVVLEENYHRISEDMEYVNKFNLILEALSNAKIDTISSRSKSVLSTYFGKLKSPLFVENTQKNAVPLEEFSPLFLRYKTPAELMRIYVDSSDKIAAEKIINKINNHD